MKKYVCICGANFGGDKDWAIEHVKQKAREGYFITHQIEETEVRD